MNREQIAKALECCIKNQCENCCQCGDWHEQWNCMTFLMKNALALIKELTEENERFRYEQGKLIEARDTFREYAFNMQKYVEHIKYYEEEGYSPSAAKSAAEMEMWRVVALEKRRLVEENEKIGIENFDLVCELSRIKEDTVRDIRERLTTFFAADDILKYVEVDAEYINSQIDRIAKEMEEGL